MDATLHERVEALDKRVTALETQLQERQRETERYNCESSCISKITPEDIREITDRVFKDHS